MKARFSSSQSWNESLLLDGKILRYSEGRVNKTWKDGFACLRDDTSFRWYKDSEYLERKGELWLDEIAQDLRFGHGALLTYGHPTKSKNKAALPIKNKEHLLMAIKPMSPSKPGMVHWFSFCNEEQQRSWMRTFAAALDGVACMPPATSTCPRPAQSVPSYRRAISENALQRNINPWEVYWMSFCNQREFGSFEPDDTYSSEAIPITTSTKPNEPKQAFSYQESSMTAAVGGQRPSPEEFSPESTMQTASSVPLIRD